MISSADALGRKSVYYYNSAGEQTHRINAAGEVQLSSYDSLGRVSASVQLARRIGATDLASFTGARSVRRKAR